MKKCSVGGCDESCDETCVETNAPTTNGKEDYQVKVCFTGQNGKKIVKGFLKGFPEFKVDDVNRIITVNVSAAFEKKLSFFQYVKAYWKK